MQQDCRLASTITQKWKLLSVLKNRFKDKLVQRTIPGARSRALRVEYVPFSLQITFCFKHSISLIVHPNLSKLGWCVKRSWVYTMQKVVQYTMCHPEDMKRLRTITVSRGFNRKAAKWWHYLIASYLRADTSHIERPSALYRPRTSLHTNQVSINLDALWGRCCAWNKTLFGEKKAHILRVMPLLFSPGIS